MHNTRETIVTLVGGILMVFVTLIIIGRILALPTIEQQLISLAFAAPLCALYWRWMSGSHGSLWLTISLTICTWIACWGHSFVAENPSSIHQFCEFLVDNQPRIIFCLLCLMMARFIMVTTNGFSHHFAQFAIQLTKKGTARSAREKVTPFDRSVIAVHEAGHAILLGLHKDLPDSAELVMRDEAEDTGSLGHCTGVRWEHRIGQKSFVEWNMLFCLAGIEAERLVLGEISLGGSNDYRNWQALAYQYLEGHDSIVYFHEIRAPWHEDFNAKVLYDLKEQQKAAVREMLLENEDILMLLRDGLLERGELRGKDLLATLSMVKATPNTPASPLLKSAHT